MKKFIISMMALAVTSMASFAQAGKNQISIGPEVNIPMGDLNNKEEEVELKTGLGGSIKGLFGVGTAGQITLTAGFTSFKFKGLEDEDDVKASYRILPVMLGYRQNFSGFYVEPQVGFGSYSFKIKEGGLSINESKSALTYALGLGYAAGPIDIGARYQSASVKFEDADESSTNSLIGIRVAYVFNLGRVSSTK